MPPISQIYVKVPAALRPRRRNAVYFAVWNLKKSCLFSSNSTISAVAFSQYSFLPSTRSFLNLAEAKHTTTRYKSKTFKYRIIFQRLMSGYLSKFVHRVRLTKKKINNIFLLRYPQKITRLCNRCVFSP